ncbi:hypothetical protein N0V90_009568 [Kalmusia sp. IMI 367209]|nr:hypothetical protein N0V90_009568 [Kalmusia sp. IMI 367209]
METEMIRYPQPAGSVEVELQQEPSVDDTNAGFSLPPTDGGKHAWLFLFSCFMLEGLIWGFAASYGIFQEYYSTHEPFAGSSNIAVVGACAMGIMYMWIIPMFVLLKCFPRLRIWATPVGLTIMCLALGLGSLATNVTHLIISQGIMYAIGGGLAWTPILFYIEEWWVRRRGFAYGATMAGLGLSGAILPIILQWLLNSYGFRTTLRVCALSFVALNFPVLFVFKPRLPLSQTSQSRSFDMSFWTCSNYLILQSSNIIQGLGYFLPAIYLPTFARSLGASNFESTVTIILLNAAAYCETENLKAGARRTFIRISPTILTDENFNMRSVIVLALTGASIAAPFIPFDANEHDVFRPAHFPKPKPTLPYQGVPTPSFTFHPYPTGTGVSPPIIPTGTGISTPVLPTGTGGPIPTDDLMSILPFFPPVATPAVERRGLEIDYKLAPRHHVIGDLKGGDGRGHHGHPRPHRPHGTGYPTGGFPHPTGGFPHPTEGFPHPTGGFPFPSGTSGFGLPTIVATPKLTVPINAE